MTSSPERKRFDAEILQLNSQLQECADLLARERTLRAQAEAENRAKDDFLANLSHELRMPSNAILGWLQILQTGKHDDAISTPALRAIERSARVQAKLIEDLLNVPLIASGRLPLDMKPLSLVAVTEAAIESLRPSIMAKEIKFSTLQEPDADKVTADAVRIQQIICNLLANVVKFTPRGGKIELRLTRRDHLVWITVEDDGEGISNELLPFVFDRFRQVDSSRNHRHDGLGLGLAIVRLLTELHGGTVKAESPGAGLGARLTVQLPIQAQYHLSGDGDFPRPKHLAKKMASSWPSLNGVCIVSVDDDDRSREMLCVFR